MAHTQKEHCSCSCSLWRGVSPAKGCPMHGRTAEVTAGHLRGVSPLRARPNHALRIKDSSALTLKTQDLPQTTLEKYGFQICTVIMLATSLLGGFLLKEASIPQPWSSISNVAGWSYFAAWSLSFYPQLYLNWRRKSVVGYSFDFALTNVLGFACLSIYYCSFYFDRTIREQYRASHNGSDNAVRANDVFFALHALLLTCLTLGQIGIYDRGSQRVSTLCKWAVGSAMAFIIIYAALLTISPRTFSAITFLYLLSYIKVGVTASKYIPQVLLNYRRKSTVGFNIGQMILDLAGGILSLAQLALEAIVLKDSSIVTGDPVKLFLGLLSVIYDTLIIYQHYVLYRDSKPRQPSAIGTEHDAESLLPPRDSEEVSAPR